ncbi:MAG: DUF502 domain-containing protein [Syntrophales bacterium]|jgi:uncharacterized membrane protein|nr:DUF502 domain-containing protein [Syntrophales bacterium]MCK9528679.1 DUF502 domain-containing protein [Syntrophales bacterium]MDX9922015.1 DUF502 domain-containing protein [Syntrophales bacterium]
MKKSIKRVFITGLAALIPIGIVVYLLIFLVRMMKGLARALMSYFQIDGLLPVPGIEFVVLIVLIFLVGLIVRSYVGKKVVAWGETLLDKIPVVRTIYIASKQLTHAIFSEDSTSFSRVVLIEYPRRGVYSIAFVSGITRGELQDKTRNRMINVFVPTTPNPTSGFLLLVPEEDTITLDMPIDHAFALIVSGGIFTPQDIKKIIEEEKRHADHI